MAKWQIYLYGIEWDDGKGEYDVSSLPENLCIVVDHEDYTNRSDAIDRALEEATDNFGSFIQSTQQIVANRLKY